MDRREFLKYSATGLASLAMAGVSDLSVFGGAAFAGTGRPGTWKFGVMADTQWKANLDGMNPGTCAVGVIEKLNRQFIAHGVEFVIQVGDLVDVEHDALNGAPLRRNMPVRAAAAQALYDAGIGFFPLRGNHEASQLAAVEFQTLYPQTRGGGSNVKQATNFRSPFATLDGLSYSFDYNNVRFVMLDQFKRTDNSGSTNDNMVDQVSWISDTLTDRASDTHAFVVSHKNLMGHNHVDNLFGSNPVSNTSARNDFIRSLDASGVRYQIGGHDHMHSRSIIKSPDGTAAVKQLIAASNSYKFYTPPTTSNDASYNYPRVESVVANELYSIGYYVFTVDGPRVTVDFYSSSHGFDYGDLDLTATPDTVFFKRESWGYSLNGKEFVVEQGASYDTVADSFGGTDAAILGGTNGDTAVDRSSRALVKTVNTGWSIPAGDASAASQVLHLWGTASSLALWDDTLTGLLPDEARTSEGDTYALSISYDVREQPNGLGRGGFGIAARDARGNWVNAVDLNYGGTKRFVVGPWNPSYALGTYGVNPASKSAWAVVNYDGEFGVRRGIELNPGMK